MIQLRLVAGQDATKEDVAVVREQLGLDDPLLVQYGKYMKGLLQEIWEALSKTVKTVRTIAPRLEANYRTLTLLIHDMGCDHRYCDWYYRSRISWQNS